MTTLAARLARFFQPQPSTAQADTLVEETPEFVVEHGSFAYGACRNCSWRGTGRRARSLALRDAQEHQQCGAHVLPE